MSQENNFIPNQKEYCKLRPFPLFMKNNFPFIENTYEALDIYGLLCKIVEFLNEVIKNENIVTENQQAVYDAFVELNNYVSNYFDNLDVQEEINNKLDKMVEDGTLPEIVADYLQTKAVFGFDTVADMKDDSNLINGSYARTLGYHEINDGGSALYKIRNITNDDVIDEMFIIALNDETNILVAELIVEDSINIRQLGANEVVANDTKALKGFANSSYKSLVIPNGNYKLNDTVDLEDKELIGIGKPEIDIVGITTAREHTIHVAGSCIIKNIDFKLSIANTNILGFFNSDNTIIENCSFIVDDVACNGYFDVYSDNKNLIVKDCYFECSSLLADGTTNSIGGIWVRGNASTDKSENITFENCKIKHINSSDEMIAVWGANISNVNINNCTFENLSTVNPWIIRLETENLNFNNCIFIDNSNTQHSGFLKYDNYLANINKCIYKLNATYSNGINAMSADRENKQFYINDSTIINQKSSNMGCAIYKNCKISGPAIHFNQRYNKIYNCTISASAQDGWIFSREIEVDGLFFENFTCQNSGTLFIQTFSNMDYLILRNIKFNSNPANVQRTLFYGGNNIEKLIIENCTLPGSGTIFYGTGTVTGGHITNNLYYGTISDITNVSANNNYQITN